jgi:hypothetical protein
MELLEVVMEINFDNHDVEAVLHEEIVLLILFLVSINRLCTFYSRICGVSKVYYDALADI